MALVVRVEKYERSEPCNSSLGGKTASPSKHRSLPSRPSAGPAAPPTHRPPTCTLPTRPTAAIVLPHPHPAPLSSDSQPLQRAPDLSTLLAPSALHHPHPSPSSGPTRSRLGAPPKAAPPTPPHIDDSPSTRSTTRIPLAQLSIMAGSLSRRPPWAGTSFKEGRPGPGAR